MSAILESPDDGAGPRLLVDAQLPLALARWLTAAGVDALHVVDVGLQSASDRELWAWARREGRALVTKDEDFRDLSIRLGPPPPVVWVRIGNCRKSVLLAAFARVLPALLDSLRAGESLVELRG